MNSSNSAGMIRAASLSGLPGIRHGFFTRTGGVSEGIYASLNGGIGSRDVPAKVAENRARMAAALAVGPERLLTAYQTHSADVVTAEIPWSPDTRPRVDAIVTRARGLAIGVTTADCGPVLFADAQAGVIGAAHAGWRGAFQGVLEATIEALERCGADRSRLVVALGPMIRQPNYEVGPEFVARFEAADAANDRFFKASARADHALFDLAGYIAARLRRCGIDHIEDVGRCTYGSPREFFSYRGSTHRGEPDYGRHVNGIALSELP
jgi:purine-nucleoside/S-methyl-5'-thioadenosine phosphorylase / adenosine deaminase